MNAVGLVLCVILCSTRGINAVPGYFAHNEETVFDTLVGLIDADIIEAADLMYKHVKFERPNSGSLERVFRNKFDLFLGVPREILATGLDLRNDDDFDILNEFFRPYASPAIPWVNRNENGPPPIEAIDAFPRTVRANVAGPVPRKFDSLPKFAAFGGRSDDSAATTITGKSNNNGGGPPRTIPDRTREQRPKTSLAPRDTDKTPDNVNPPDEDGVTTVPHAAAINVQTSGSSSLSCDAYDYGQYENNYDAESPWTPHGTGERNIINS
ncbi:Hypothetical protein CINCED_3A022636 [Cinara cedri]|uniref:Uncharacterized protein n=1 Tax=Cinara cedri TaxID=506608 RepID=A0A5E4MQ83_9HEMI|nr:Hypothetical protein CINCED_3A022636 [Cinara cedri]